jgi:trypsin
MKRNSHILSISFTAVALIAPSLAPAVIMRHDVIERRFLELGRKFPASVSVRPADVSKGLGAEGTLIAPRWVLTAAHVAADVGPNDIVEVAGKSYVIESVHLHPEWHRVNDLTRDIALVRLKTAVTSVRPVALSDGKERVGSLVTIVGRGGTGTGLTGPTGDEDRRLRAVTNLVYKMEDPYVEFRFDPPGEIDATELEGICGPGDSGGAAYFQHDGKLFVIGVSSWQDTHPANRHEGFYGVIEYYLSVPYFREWILATMQVP